MARRKIAVVGSGIAGLTAGYVLQRSADVTLYEADERLGGHADTHEIIGRDGVLRAVDTGFIVHNLRTYPNLLRLFGELGVTTQESDMSMSISCGGCGLEYAGGGGLSGLVPSLHTVRNPRYLRMLREVGRFHRRAHALLDGPDDGATVGEFLDAGGFSDYFRAHFMTPLIAAVWSTAPSQAGDYPARYLFAFLDNHGMLAVTGSPAWYTVTGGSARYVERAAKSLTSVQTSTPVRAIERHAGGVTVRDEADVAQRFDGVVIATHPHQAVRLLAAPTAREADLLGRISYTVNPTVLHTDTSLLPRAKRARASWNYSLPGCDVQPTAVQVSYDMTRLQRLDGPQTYVVTLNGEDRIDPAAVLDRMDYEHPLYTTDSVAARDRLPELNDGTIAYAGAYHGWGFHEDGCRSGVDAAGSIGRLVVITPAIYDVDIVHVRAEPVRHDVRHRSYLWFVDLDDLPAHGPLARFRSRDHLGDPSRTLRENLDEFLAEHGVDLRGGQVTMLTNARSLGYVFNPLTLYWCHERDGAIAAVVAEVHNTYGERHRYLLRTDDAGRIDVPKEFYVSPFYPVDGSYRMSLPEPGEQLAITITLHRPGQRPFTASVRGVRRPATHRAVLAAALRHPLETWAVRALITVHGVRLWAKRLPVQQRPPHPADSTPALATITSEEQPMASRATVAQRLESLVQDVAGIELPIRLRAWDGSETGPADGPVVVVRNRRALRRLLWAPGELGLARAYVTGDLDVEGDLADGFRRVWELARSRPSTGSAVGAGGALRAAGAATRLGALGIAPRPPISEARLTGRLHTRLRDRAAIAHHYDLSNDFYELLLDDTMAYSSAYFTHEGQSLEDAQRTKLDLICRKLDLKPGMRLLDVGCGWGSMILHAAEHYGVHATGITLSAQQRDLVVKRIADRGLADRVEVRLQDYRELGESSETFDAVSSIEMGEHVGEGQYPTYAGVLYAALKPTGRLLLQQMSRAEDTAPGGGAFIESYIAPDMHMRPLWQTARHLLDAGFEVRDVEAMREHYVTTVGHWIDTLESHWDEFVALLGEEVARVWRLYLVGGSLAFEEGRMGVDQFLAVKTTTGGVSGFPSTRPWAVAAADPGSAPA